MRLVRKAGHLVPRTPIHMLHTCLRGVNGKPKAAAEEVASTVPFPRALRVGDLALLGQGIQHEALGLARNLGTLWKLHSKVKFARGRRCLRTVREKLVIRMPNQAQGAFILETADETCI